MNDEHKPIEWEKPAWTKETRLKKTGKSAAENLAKPITDLPHMKDGATPHFEKPQWTGEVKEDKGIHGDLAKPITGLPHGAGAGDESLSFKKPEWTQDAGLQNTGKGAALKEGKEISRPIGGIKQVDEY